MLIGIPAGTLAALRRGGWLDRVASGGRGAWRWRCRSSCVGTLLVLLFAQTLRWVPAGGYVPFARDPVQHLMLLTMPALTIALGLAAVVFRMTRASVLDVLPRDYVRTARAKGLAPRADPACTTCCAMR